MEASVLGFPPVTTLVVAFAVLLSVGGRVDELSGAEGFVVACVARASGGGAIVIAMPG
jgi:hypothetical protein